MPPQAYSGASPCTSSRRCGNARAVSRSGARVRRNLKPLRVAARVREGGRVGAAHQHLAAERPQRVEKGAAPARIEMCRDLVEQHQRRDAAHRGDKPGLGQHQAHHQCFLLARRGPCSVDRLGAVPDCQVAEMRADARAPRRHVAGPVLAQHVAIQVLDLDGRALGQSVLDVPPKRHLGPGKRRGIVAAFLDQGGEARDRLGPCGRHRDPEARHLVFGGFRPGPVERSGPTLLEDAVAAPQRAVERIDPGRVVGIHRQHDTVKEAAPLGRGAAEQAVHGGREPHYTEILGESLGGGHDGPVDAAAPGRHARRVGRIDPGADLVQPVLVLLAEFDRDGPAARAALAREVARLRAPQPPAGREHGQGFEQVGLPGAVLAGECHHGPADAHIERRVGAEVGQDQASNPRSADRAAGRLGRHEKRSVRCLTPASA